MMVVWSLCDIRHRYQLHGSDGCLVCIIAEYISRCRFTYIMMYYHRICVGYTLMFAAEELESDSVVLKDMKLGSQRTISLKDAVDEVSSLCR